MKCWQGEKMEENLVRIQKYLASHGVASRRKCEQDILEGKVKVNRNDRNRIGTKDRSTKR